MSKLIWCWLLSEISGLKKQKSSMCTVMNDQPCAAAGSVQDAFHLWLEELVANRTSSHLHWLSSDTRSTNVFKEEGQQVQTLQNTNTNKTQNTYQVIYPFICCHYILRDETIKKKIELKVTICNIKVWVCCRCLCACTIISLSYYGLLLIFLCIWFGLCWLEGGRKQACSGFFFFITHHINISDFDPVLFITAQIHILW